MKTVIRRMTRCKSLIFLLFLLIMYYYSGVQKVSAEEIQKQAYLIKVNRACNTITVYEKGNSGKYDNPIKAMTCSVGKGTRTITGTFQTKAKYRWKALMGDVWGQYATRIVGGILFHSVYYYENENPASLATKEFNKLGTAASHGCIRLTVGDAKWIYDNCSVGTTVVIYDDKINPGPLGKPTIITLPAYMRWDPTDPNDKNPYKDKLPKITGAKDQTVDWGEEIDFTAGIKAKSSVGLDITSEIRVDGTVDYYKPGDYTITYSVKDALGKEVSKTVKLTVSNRLSVPEFAGISDKIVNGDITVDEAFALDGVEAYCSEVKLDKKYFNVIIEEITEVEYLITYQIIIEDNIAATDQATVYVDREAPVLNGVTDLWLEEGEIPDKYFVMQGITASDNYSNPENIMISVTIDKSPEEVYTAVYEAVDEAGNSTKEQVTIFN